MYIFKAWHLTVPTGLIAGGFAFVEYYKNRDLRTWDVDAVFLIFLFFGSITYPYMLEAGMKYQNYMTDTSTPTVSTPTQAEPPHMLPNLGEMHQYTQTFPTVTERKEKQFAKTLLEMRTLEDGDKKVDLREDRWRLHFGSRDNYVAVRSRLEQAHAVRRKDARINAPFIVNDWRVVQLMAQGAQIK